MLNHQGQIHTWWLMMLQMLWIMISCNCIVSSDSDQLSLIGTVRNPSIEPIVLAKRWGITPEKLIRLFMQWHKEGWGLCSTLHCHPSLSRWFRTNDRNLCYHHLVPHVFSDMMYASTVSRGCNRSTQVYATDFGWARAFSMVSSSEAHKTSLLLFLSRYSWGWSGISGGTVFSCGIDANGGILLGNGAHLFNKMFKFCIAFIVLLLASVLSQSACSRFLVACMMRSVGTMCGLCRMWCWKVTVLEMHSKHVDGITVQYDW